MACPICNKPTEKAHRPFCSVRCADVDLGKWLSGSYAIPSTDPDDADQLENEPAQGPEGKPH